MPSSEAITKATKRIFSLLRNHIKTDNNGNTNQELAHELELSGDLRIASYLQKRPGALWIRA